MRFIIFLLITLLASCSESQEMEWVCDCGQQKAVSEFVTANMKNANNMSDEEMEDVIRELRFTGIKLNCRQKLMWQDSNGEINWSIEKLDSCEVWIDTRFTH